MNNGPVACFVAWLLDSLSEPRLRTSAYLQPGLYIAEISENGYLGRVLYKIKGKQP
ncbi:MAG: hypothetical protein NTZ12_00790 [Candidatus Aminicenantes bacterium]|nr:hypothetical protein [Candidatus Aminicenantes bacterium]